MGHNSYKVRTHLINFHCFFHSTYGYTDTHTCAFIHTIWIYRTVYDKVYTWEIKNKYKHKTKKVDLQTFRGGELWEDGGRVF